MSLLEAHGVTVNDRRQRLLRPTSLQLETGDLLIAYGDPGHGHTALALTLAGRLEPHEGTVTLDGDAKRTHLQRAVALVDVPGVSEPDDNLPLTTIVGEELAMAHHSAGRRHVRRWLDEQGLGDYVGDRMEDLSTGARVKALARLAALRKDVSFLVLTLPERHGELATNWLGTVRALADDGFGVLVTTSVGVAEPLLERTTALGNMEDE
ncbi:MAG: hypothetical protein JWR35_1702 [Marmoricola sp.]|nr:hypothetical protein [Marmoricola sp.]